MVLKHRVDEWRRQIDPTSGRLEHLLDQVADLPVVQDRGGQLRPAAPGDKHPVGLVDPTEGTRVR